VVIGNEKVVLAVPFEIADDVDMAKEADEVGVIPS
jgi:hypothetical protein